MVEQKNLYELNALLPNKEALYDILSDKFSLVLPNIQSRACSIDYLLKCSRFDVYTIKQEHYRVYNRKLKQKRTTSELIELLEKLAPGKPLGFDAFAPPNKLWLINVIYSLKSEHPIFVLPKPIIQRAISKEYYYYLPKFLFRFL